MLDRLPVELVSHTLSFVDPPSPNHLVKSASLYACCLVSKRIKEVAQPLLWRAVVLDRRGDFQPFEREVATGELGRHVRILAADGEDIKATEVGALVQSLPDLAEVRLRNSEVGMSNAVDGLLPHLQQLNRLDMISVDFCEIRTPFPFNNLSSLFLSKVKTTKSFLSRLLQPQYLPELSCLHFRNPCRQLDGYALVPFFPSLSNALLDQLDILQLPLIEAHSAPIEIFQSPITLLSGTVYDLDAYLHVRNLTRLVKNLLIRGYGLDEERLRSKSTTLQFVRDTLGKLSAFIPSSNIATLLLPVPLE